MWSQKALIAVFSYMWQNFFIIKDMSAYDRVEAFLVIKNRIQKMQRCNGLITFPYYCIDTKVKLSYEEN